MTNIGFVGLGVMGGPMASHLSNNGYNLSVFNRSKEKSEKWSIENTKAKVCWSPKDIAINSDIIILCVGNDQDVRQVIGEVEGWIKPGTVVIDHTTTSANLAKDMNEILAKKESYFIDAPVSGGEAGAQQGTLSIMVGGDKEIYISIEELLGSYSKFTKFMGPSGHGQLTKMVNQICIAGLIQSLAEGLHFSKKVGLEAEDVIEVISKGAAQSWQMDNRWESMIEDEYDHGFAVDLMRKDLDIVLEQAKTVNANLEITDLVNSFYENIQNSGGGRWDTSSLLRRLES
ncbi:MAG: NAD(P)-dependent oxidoreductase [Proteobacteria bacterium]|jgi:3-hydroxyisobutyrate dehydrogenase-like beta-hydroxyacid dehydrogenase|nr:NAD(P)-dependent oxidoreductase [Pseudomonadota bacterium]